MDTSLNNIFKLRATGSLCWATFLDFCFALATRCPGTSLQRMGRGGGVTLLFCEAHPFIAAEKESEQSSNCRNTFFFTWPAFFIFRLLASVKKVLPPTSGYCCFSSPFAWFEIYFFVVTLFWKTRGHYYNWGVSCLFLSNCWQACRRVRKVMTFLYFTPKHIYIDLFLASPGRFIEFCNAAKYDF